MPRKKPAVDYTALRNYDKAKKVRIEELFDRQIKLLNEQLRRTKEHMFREDNMGYDRDIARQIKDMTTAITSCGQMFFKIQEMARHAAENMNPEEQMEAVCDLVRGFGRNNRYKFWRMMRELEFELNAEDELGASE